MSTRRDFLIAGAGAGAGLVVAVRWGRAAELSSGDTPPFVPDAWIRIDAEGTVTLTVARSEMGQGVRTSMPMILAEELEADWSRIRVVQAMPSDVYGGMSTGGSHSVEGGWGPLRRAGAAARTMLVAAAAARWEVSPATCRAREGRVLHAPSGRALGYGELVADAAKMPVPQDPPLKGHDEFRIVGHGMRRLDGPDIVAGQAEYGLDVRVPGMRFATVVRCPVLGGSLRGFDDTRARAVPGVRDVVAVSSGVAIVADSTWAALEARDALDVTWDEGPHASFGSAGLWADLEAAADRKGFESRREGDVEAALASADRRVDAVYHWPCLAHAALEPINYVADVRPDRCTLWGGTQNPQSVQRAVAGLLGLPLDSVEVHVSLMGGAFGRRLAVDYAVEAAEVSRAARTPVQVVWTREDDLHFGHFQPPTVQRLAAGLDASGRLVAWFHRKAGSFLTLYPPDPEDLKDPAWYRGSAWGQYDVPYAAPALVTEYSRVESPIRTGPWRAVYAPSCTFSVESFVDEVAHAAGRDPLEFRLGLLDEPRWLEIGNDRIDRHRVAGVLRLAAEKAGWGRPLPRDGRRWGRGIAVTPYRGRTCVAEVAEVSVGAGGDLRVHRVVCAVDCGTAVNPLGIEGQVESAVYFALSAALCGEITYAGGRVQQTNYSDYDVLRIDAAPEVEVHIVPSRDNPNGIGEPPVCPAAPAVMNAVFAATGKRIRRLPLRRGDLG